jgi:PadR family transcriptional regulator, regulatory protein AphA
MSRCTMPNAASAPSRPQTTTSFAVLGLLSVRSWTTYELAKQVQRSLNWFWPRAERKLYDEPKALVAAGLATARKEYTGQRASTVYDITPAGREALRAWLGVPPAPRSAEFEAMLQVFFADAGSLQQLRSTLDAVEADSVRRLQDLAAMAAPVSEGDTAFPERLHISAIALRLQFQEEAAVLGWVRWAREQTAKWRSTTDPGTWNDRRAFVDLVSDVESLLAR